MTDRQRQAFWAAAIVALIAALVSAGHLIVLTYAPSVNQNVSV